MSNKEIKEALKEIEVAPFGSYERNEVFDRVRDKGLGWIREQQTLIDQLEERNRHLQGMFNSQNRLGQRYYEEKEHANSSLELAVKALEEIAMFKEWGIANDSPEEIARLEERIRIIAGKASTALDQIRRVET